MDGYAGKGGAQSMSRFTSTGRAVMQKKYQINDGTTKFQEMNTLLEPSNNAAAAQNEQEEINEVSGQLSQIKKKHDEAKKAVTLKQAEYDRIRKEIMGLEVQEANIEGPIAYNKERLAQLAQSLQETEDKIDRERMAQRTYNHMLERMKKDFIAGKLKTTDLETSLRNKSQVRSVEEDSQRKTKEEKLQSKNIFDNLMKNIEKEQRDRQERILELQRCIANKEESVKRRIERQKKNQEIAETAANESKDSTELKMRNYLYINRLWNNFMKKKMHKEMESSRSIDEAFKQIKTHTGVTDVQAMVRRFQIREETYTALLQTVSTSEAKVDTLKKDNEELTKKLQELQIDDTGDNEEKKVDENDEEIINMNKDLTLVNRDYQQIQERFKKVNIVNDQISNWTRRCYQKFGTLTEDQLFQQEPSDLVSMFESMNTVVLRELDALKIQDEQDGGDEGVDYGEVFTDFATPEFLDKNVRVRPISGVTHGDDTRDGRQSNISRGMGGEGGLDDGDHLFNQGAASDLEQQRNAIKAKKAAYDELERKRIAAEEKAKRDK